MQRPPLLLALLATVAAFPAGAEEPGASIPPQEVLEPEPAPSDLGVTPPTPVEESPWSRGVPDERRRAADALFLEGNKLLRESLAITALAKYREALEQWDHPNIHFNLALALMFQDQPVELYEHLEKAVQYGVKPLEQERYQHAKNYMALLEKQLVRAEIRCDVPEGQVELDGRPLFATPGRWEGLVRAGRHTLVASRDGYVTNQSVRSWEGGKPVAVNLELKTVDELTVHRRRWSAWGPWTLLGAGAAVAAAGGALHYTGRDRIRSANEEARRRCASGVTCTAEPPEVARMRRDGTRMQAVGVGAYAVGGAALVAGGILVWLNRDETRIRAYDDGEQPLAPPEARLEVFPLLTPERTGVSVAVRF